MELDQIDFRRVRRVGCVAVKKLPYAKIAGERVVEIGTSCGSGFRLLANTTQP